MKTRVLHLMKGLLRRFKWDTLALIAVSVTASLWAILDADSSPPAALRWLEVALVIWFGLRMALAESAYGTHAGWAVRPFASRDPFIAQLSVMVVILAPLLALRTFAVSVILSPTPAGWVSIIGHSWAVPLGAYLVGFVSIAWATNKLGRRTPIPFAHATGVGLVLLCVIVAWGFTKSENHRTLRDSRRA